MTPTDDDLDICARSLHAQRRRTAALPEWEALPDWQREKLRRQAAAVIAWWERLRMGRDEREAA